MLLNLQREIDDDENTRLKEILFQIVLTGRSARKKQKTKKLQQRATVAEIR
jgi:hypothetical protein